MESSHGWGPRLGVAYQVTPKTVARAGFGIFYASEKAPGLTPSNAGFTSSPSWSSTNSGITPAFYWDQGFPAWQPPPFINPGFNAGFGISWWPAAEIAQLPSTNSWNVALSRALPGSFVLDLVDGRLGGSTVAMRQLSSQPQPDGERHQLLLGSVVDVPLELASFGVLRGDDALAGGPELLQARQQLLGEPNVSEHQPGTRGQVGRQLLLGR